MALVPVSAASDSEVLEVIYIPRHHISVSVLPLPSWISGPFASASDPRSEADAVAG